MPCSYKVKEIIKEPVGLAYVETGDLIPFIFIEVIYWRVHLTRFDSQKGVNNGGFTSIQFLETL